MPPLRRAAGPRRFLQGTPHIPCLYAAMEGLRIIREVGVEMIRAHSMRQTARLLAAADGIGLETPTPRDPARRAGTVTVNPPDAEPVARALLERDFLIDYRPGAGIRIAPHFYTTDEECDAVMAEIAALVKQRPALRLTKGR
jgi:kynureninase